MAGRMSNGVAHRAGRSSRRIAAAVPIEQVLRTWYDRIPEDSWAWAQALYVGDSDDGFLIAEDDDGYLWKVPYTVSGNDVDFGEPSRVRTEFVDTGDDTGDKESVTVQAGMQVVHCSSPPDDVRPADVYLRGGIIAAAVAPHSTATSDGSWDSGANEANLSNDDGADVYRQAYAWQDDDADNPDAKASWRFLHHEVSADGTVGAANTTACSTGIGVLNGGRGVDVAAQPWADDRSAIHAHLAKHLTDADMEPPELVDLSPGSETTSAAHVTATKPPPRPKQPVKAQSSPQETPMERTELIERLGLPEDASDDDIDARVAELEAARPAAESADPPAEGEPSDGDEPTSEPPKAETEPAPPAEDRQPEPVAASKDRQTILAELKQQGFAIIDSDRLARLEGAVTDYEAEKQERAKQERDRVLAEAVKAGKFAPSRLDHFKKLWEKDPEGTRDFVEHHLNAGLIPVGEKGHSTEPEEGEVTDPEVKAVSSMIRSAVAGRNSNNGQEG